jgi:zinc protease
MVRANRHVVLAAVHIAVAAAAGPVAAQEHQVAERVFLVRDKPGTPTQFHMIVLAGCSDEADGQCRGLAHYLEHLVLGGRNPEHKEIATRIFPDASSNGWTNLRATAYLHSVPARDNGPKADLETLFTFYAARLRDFSIGEEEALRERNVVLQEHDWRVASSPFRRFERKLDRELIPDHPSGQWTIGTPQDIQRFTLADAKAFHRQWYVVNNAYFVVKADIEPSELKGIAERALAGLEPGKLPPRATARKPELPIERKELREADAQVKRAAVTYKKLVRMEAGDTLAQRAARAVLLNYLRSRLAGSPYPVLVDTGKVAAGAPSVSIERVAPATFTLRIAAEVALDSTPEALLAAIGAYVDGMAGAPLAAETVERLKKRMADARANSDQDPALVYSSLIGWLAGRNSYEEFRSWPDRIATVPPADIQQVLAALSGPGKVATGILTPAAQEAGR